MDETAILEHELIDNTKTVYHGGYGPVSFFRPNPALNKKIAEERRRVYHRDLKNSDILTSEEVLALLKTRGIWSDEQAERLEELTVRSAELMTKLTALGYDTPARFYLDWLKVVAEVKKAYPEPTPDVSDALGRVFSLETTPDTSDLMALRKEATSSTVHELLDSFESLCAQAKLSREFVEVKTELSKLIETHTKYFGDTIESRAQQAEKMAKLYYCTVNADGKPLWDKVEDVWEDDPENLAWLAAQMYYFEYGITEEYARALEVHGFMGRVIVTEDSSESSQDHPQSNLDGEPLESKPQDSSVSAEPTI